MMLDNIERFLSEDRRLYANIIFSHERRLHMLQEYMFFCQKKVGHQKPL